MSKSFLGGRCYICCLLNLYLKASFNGNSKFERVPLGYYLSVNHKLDLKTFLSKENLLCIFLNVFNIDSSNTKFKIKYAPYKVSSINDVTALKGGSQVFCNDSTKASLLKSVTIKGLRGSKIVQNCVTSFMDDLKGPQHFN